MTGPLRTGAPGGETGDLHVAIVGGGASGVLMALHLLNRPDSRCRVTVLEGAHLLGCGIAYSTDDPDHLLNTRVQNMSAFPGDPDHFRRWLAAQGTPRTGADFVTRATYGSYLGSLLAPWQAGRRLTCLRRTCTRVQPLSRGYRLHLAGAEPIRADQVVLATGHAVASTDPHLHNAWQPVAGLNPDARVLILGTGLSMVDQVLSLLSRGHRGPITALSRRGLLPREHAPVAALPLTAADLPDGAPVSGWLRWLRAQSATAPGGWHAVVDGLRPHLRRLWATLPETERRRFLRHAVSWWDVHRHRIPPASAERLAAALDSGQLQLRRGRFLGATRDAGAALRVAVRTAAAPEDLTADLVIDCRGIRRDPGDAASPLIRDLLARGLARVDPLRISLDVGADCRLHDAAGGAQEGLWAIGPVSRAAFWEITAIPDIREQTHALADRILDPAPAAAA